MLKRLQNSGWWFALGLILVVVCSGGMTLSVLPPAVAQSPARQIQQGQISEQVYQNLPDLPREDDYTNVRTGERDLSNTLVDRLVRYHYYVKGRSTQYRLDWKLTIADYLGANERIDPNRYPSASRSERNPLTGDIAVLGSLGWQRRDELIQALLVVFNLEAQANPAADGAALESTIPVQSPVITQPGAADLLR
ncbi:MAG: hypothetical protein HC886_23590 [Leptolyngbyaceae cyanobacterium SM1_1_3]|nr:hypothetical protein [Leptolyngbyaceae cyanobacterium SM1_1_3]NJM85724.1 hypothetical protein [Leptolyngbyaceae cyanobacterium RM2_2_21]NJN04934.1 hypothetical protein [Leptolyngbyaceae cyanobacterium RM1_1_2]NJO11742.1 hypothetical protein [Leptolyngbyaceae cyanobacterium SL_1_1]